MAGRLVLVDAHGLLASSLVVALASAGFETVGPVDPDRFGLESESVAAVVAAGDLVLLGLLYGDGRTTLWLIRPLTERGCRVMVLMSEQGLPLAGECLHRGAEAIIDKAMSFERLVGVLRRLTSGGCAMTQDERSAPLESVERHHAAERALHKPFEALTEREMEVLAALVAGAAPKQIAAANGITISTVRGHIRGVLAKLDVCTQREALAMARHAGWPEHHASQQRPRRCCGGLVNVGRIHWWTNRSESDHHGPDRIVGRAGCPAQARCEPETRSSNDQVGVLSIHGPASITSRRL